MRVLGNEDIERLLPMADCIAALEPMYADYAQGKALLSPRVDNMAPTDHEGAYYAFKHMGGTWPAQNIQALRINSDVVTHPDESRQLLISSRLNLLNSSDLRTDCRPKTHRKER